MNANQPAPPDPLDALLENALRTSSTALAAPATAGPFRARVIQQIERHQRRLRFLRALPWTLGTLASLLVFLSPARPFEPGKLLAASEKLPPLPTLDLLPPDLLANASALLNTLHLSPLVLAETAVALAIGLGSMALIRRQPDFRW